MRKLVSRHSIEIKSWFTYGIFICTIMFLSYRNVLHIKCKDDYNFDGNKINENISLKLSNALSMQKYQMCILHKFWIVQSLILSCHFWCKNHLSYSFC